jgi:hypothetical protein
MEKIGRNDPCPCGSGKKFKKCCESKMIGRRFMATKIETAAAKSQNLSSLFNKSVSVIKTTPEDQKTAGLKPAEKEAKESSTIKKRKIEKGRVKKEEKSSDSTTENS